MELLYNWNPIEKNRKLVIMPKARRKEKLHGCQKAIIPPPRIGNDRDAEMEYDLIMQQVNSLSHRKEPEAGR